MPIKCLSCESVLKGNAIPVKCPLCGNTDLTKYIRVVGSGKNEKPPFITMDDVFTALKIWVGEHENSIEDPHSRCTHIIGYDIDTKILNDGIEEFRTDYEKFIKEYREKGWMD